MRMFTSDSLISGQLRRLFGSDQVKAGAKVNYPPLIQRSTDKIAPSPLRMRPSVHYPRSLRPSPEQPNQSCRPGRRPLQVIRGDSTLWTQDLPREEKGKDLTLAKIRLQEQLQFSPSGILPQNRRISQMSSVQQETNLKIRNTPSREEIMSRLITDISEWQNKLESKPSMTKMEKMEIQNQIQRGIRELKLMSELV